MKMNWTMALSEDNRVLYRKELIRAGKYEKASDGIKFEIDEPFLAHLELSHKERLADGVKTPVPLGHDEAEGNNRGWLRGVEKVGKSLFGVFEINGITPEELQNYDVSLFIPPTHIAGNGKSYDRPIRHAALTSYPVIPGLDRFEAIVASMTAPREENPMVDFAKLGTDLGIETAMTEETAPTLLLSAFQALRTQVTTLENTPAAKPEDELKALAEAHPSIVKMSRNARTDRIKALSLGDKPKLSKAVCDELTAFFCTDDAITLSLDESATDFDKIVGILEKNEPVVMGSITGPQSLALSASLKDGGGDDEKYPLRKLNQPAK